MDDNDVFCFFLLLNEYFHLGVMHKSGTQPTSWVLPLYYVTYRGKEESKHTYGTIFTCVKHSMLDKLNLTKLSM